MSVRFEEAIISVWRRQSSWREKAARLDGMWDLLNFTAVKPEQDDQRIDMMDDLTTLALLAEQLYRREIQEAQRRVARICAGKTA